jgi:hypothetical protein
MSKITRKEIEVPVEHPLEQIFEIEEGTTIMPQVQRSTELVVADTYDDKDVEIEGQFQEVYDAAMGAFESQFQETELIEGKYKARSGEVAVQFLNAALQAAQSKSQLKQHKDKFAVDISKNTGPKTVNNNLIVGSQSDMLEQLDRIMGTKNAPVRD